MLILSGVTQAFGDGPPLFAPITATLSPGTCVILRAGHGGGTSALLRVVAGLEAPAHGTVRLDDLSAGSPAFRRALSLVVPEHPLLPSRTLLENLVLSQRLAGQARAIAVDAAYGVLRRLDLVGLADRFPDNLSRGEHQLACIGRAVLRRPRLLLADEPGEPLRPEAAALARALLREAVVQGALVILATNAADPAAPTPDQTIELEPLPGAGTAVC